MRCPSCSHDNRPGAKFCANCGRELVLICPSCGAPNEPGKRFCGECGCPLASEREKDRRRRALAAVRMFRQRVRQFCGAVERFNELADLGRQIREFVEGTEARDLLPRGVRYRLTNVAEQLEKLKNRTERLADVCDQAEEALQYAEKSLRSKPSWLVRAAAIAAVAVVAALVAWALLGSWDVSDQEDASTPGEPDVGDVRPEVPEPAPPEEGEPEEGEPEGRLPGPVTPGQPGLVLREGADMPTDREAGIVISRLQRVLNIALLPSFAGVLPQFGPTHENDARPTAASPPAGPPSSWRA
jgi:predicted nucleic acid-binding Zn ribbon protein